MLTDERRWVSCLRGIKVEGRAGAFRGAEVTKFPASIDRGPVHFWPSRFWSTFTDHTGMALSTRRNPI